MRFFIKIALSGLLLLPLLAQAYVGPGAGLSLLGALWALILAVFGALFFLLAWPIKRMLRRRREAKASAEMSSDDTPCSELPGRDAGGGQG